MLACEHRERFLWVVSTGAMAAEDEEEREWSVRVFRRVVDGMGLGSWVDVRRVLEGVLWMEGLDGPGKRLWVELGEDVVINVGIEEPLLF